MSKAGNGAGTAPNKLYFGDNLDWLPRIDSNTVDLVYLDPPFNSNATCNVLFRSPVAEDASSQIAAFEDTWSRIQDRHVVGRILGRAVKRAIGIDRRIAPVGRLEMASRTTSVRPLGASLGGMTSALRAKSWDMGSIVE
jgi:hypothetical protein